MPCTPPAIDNPGPGSVRAFTLVEILIVVVILGILAAIVVPQFVSAASETRDNSLRMNLSRVRHQLEVYKQQHSGLYPTDETTVLTQLTLATNPNGATAAPGTAGYPFGPYLQSIPKNSFTSTATIGTGAVGSSDWYYNGTTGAFHANDNADHRAY